MLPNGRFDGALGGKTIRDFMDSVDYTLMKTEDRVAKLKEVLYTQGHSKEFLDVFFEMYFDQEKAVPHFKVALNKSDALSENLQVCKSLQMLANYLLFNKEELQKNDYSDYPYLDGNDRLMSKKRELSYEELLEKTDENGVSRLEKEVINKKNFKKKPPYKIEPKDLADVPEIKQLQVAIEYIKNNLLPKEESNTKKRFLMKVMRDLRAEQIMIKKIVRKPIEFKSLMGDETVIDFDNDTGYYLPDGEYKEVSNNRIDLSNPDHIYHLLDFYGDLKQSCADDLNSDMRYILQTLEELIETADLRDFERDVLIMKIDGLIAEDILEQIQIKYGLVWTQPYLTKIFKNVIPKKIAEVFVEGYEDWFYLNKAKGDYKQCNVCGEVKLANEHHFRARKNGNFYNTCRECETKQKSCRK